MHLYVHCSIIYNSQDLEAAQVSIGRSSRFLKLWYITQWNTTQSFKKKKEEEILPFFINLKILPDFINHRHPRTFDFKRFK